MHRARRWIGAAALAVVAGCSGSKSSPTSPTTPPPATVTAPAAVTGFAGTGMETPGFSDVATFVNRKVSFTWTSTAQASSYVLEIGSQAGAADVLSSEVSVTSADWTPVAAGDYVVQVKAKNSAGTGAASRQVTVHVLSFKSFIEALFLGSGPFADPANRGCASADRMTGWVAGSDIRIRPSTDLSPGQLEGIRAAAGQLADATGGAVRAHLDAAAESKPIARAGEISVSSMNAGTDCPAGASGCASFTRLDRGRTEAVDIFINSAVPGPGAHEMGHAAYGFCHVMNVSNGRGNAFSYMTVMGFGISGNKLTEADVLAVRAVYDAGLRAGATRSDFARAGLIDP